MHYEYALKLADTLDQLRTRSGFHIEGAHREHWNGVQYENYVVIA